MAEHFFVKCLIIGAGPAGYTAAIYAGRANLQPILVQGSQPGGQLMITTDVENYPGFRQVIQGPWLMEEMAAQAQRFETTLVDDVAMHVDFSEASQRRLKVIGKKHTYEAETIIIATGAQARWLGLPSEETFRGFGVSACATCDAFFYKDKTVFVVGGGNTAVEEALFLTRFAHKVYLVHRRDTLRAEKILQERLFKNERIHVIWNHVVEEILGEIRNQEEDVIKFVTGLTLRHSMTQELSTYKTDGVFIAIGHTPVTHFLEGRVAHDKEGYLLLREHPIFQTATSVQGVFAAGDVADPHYRQAVTAAAQGCMAALDAGRYLDDKSLS